MIAVAAAGHGQGRGVAQRLSAIRMRGGLPLHVLPAVNSDERLLSVSRFFHLENGLYVIWSTG